MLMSLDPAGPGIFWMRPLPAPPQHPVFSSTDGKILSSHAIFNSHRCPFEGPSGSAHYRPTKRSEGDGAGKLRPERGAPNKTAPQA